MSVSRGRRSRASRAFPSERRKESKKLDPTQKKLFRKLLDVLAEIMDDKGRLATDDEAIANVLEDTDSGSNIDVHDRSPNVSLALVPKSRPDEKKRSQSEPQNIAHFKRLCESHGQLTDQIRGSLNALGGGGRTAKALERMHEAVCYIRDLFNFDGEQIEDLDINYSSRILKDCRDATSEVKYSFKELGVYNKNFFDTLDQMIFHLGDVSTKLYVEYGVHPYCRVDQYIVDMFEPLARYFDLFINELTKIAEKEIAAIRQTQDFRSQRYLNLTTVATFLSSVTVSTLQITADDSQSSLASVTNTLWLVSLVFSTASAVYSLLMMTWRQSSVCQPYQSLPSLLDTLFRNGPMYALIVAVMTFSIGTCLLAFHIADQQGVFVSAIIPTAFAGVHAYTIFVFSVWFLFEQWKDKHTQRWEMIYKDYLNPLKSSVTAIYEASSGSVKLHLTELRTSFENWRTTFHKKFCRGAMSFSLDTRDIESARRSRSFIFPPEESSQRSRSTRTSEDINEGDQARETAEPEFYVAIPEGAVDTPEGESLTSTRDRTGEDKEKNLLKFSPDGFLLACAHNDTVTVYDVEKNCTVLIAIRTSDGNLVKQISWNPDIYGKQYSTEDLAGDLLVRTSETIFIWRIRRDSFSEGVQAKITGRIKEASSVQWTSQDDAAVTGLVCTSGTIIKLFDAQCKETRSLDLAKLCETGDVLLAAFLCSKYLVCLAHEKNFFMDRIHLVDMTTNTVVQSCQVMSGHTSTLVSLKAKKILLSGCSHCAEVISLLASGWRDDLKVVLEYLTTLRGQTHVYHEPKMPEEAIAFHGKDDNLIVAYSKGEIVFLYLAPDDTLFSALHIISTPAKGAIPEEVGSFAVSRGWGSEPYMFAFSDRSGSVVVWSIQANTRLSKCPPARTITVHDRRHSRIERPTTTSGRILVLPPPSFS